MSDSFRRSLNTRLNIKIDLDLIRHPDHTDPFTAPRCISLDVGKKKKKISHRH